MPPLATLPGTIKERIDGIDRTTAVIAAGALGGLLLWRKWARWQSEIEQV